MAISKYLTLLAVFIITHAIQGQKDFIQTELFSRMDKELGELCPKVDICIRNSSEPNVLPYGLIGTGNQSACCQGCSCHERCHETMNCCFPHDDNATFDKESNHSVFECLYVQTGTPDVTWPSNVPAYRIVSSAPKRGCLDFKPPEASNRDGVLPSCNNDPVAAWGNLFPVYSKEHDKIYKNAECALCHNTTDVIPWLPVLFCNEPSSHSKISISQHLQFLEQNLRTSNCYIAFHFSDPSILASKRCYHQFVSTCKLPSQINTIPAVTYTNLSLTDTRNACESGLRSPYRIDPIVYRNIYCFFCNVGAWPMHPSASCSPADNQKTTKTGMLSVLLDAVYFKKMNQDGVSDEQIALPQACVTNGPSMTSDRCRSILCPSGQIRTRTGCKFPIKAWFVDSVALMLRLNYPESQSDTLLTLVEQGRVKPANMIGRFLKRKPWPLWKIQAILHTDEAYQPDKSVVIHIVRESNSPAILFRSIKESIVKRWKVNLNGLSITFEQSLLQNHIDNFHLFHYEFIRPPPRLLTKLFVCEQVSLYSGEFNLTNENTTLISNLTVPILYNMAFELVNDVNTNGTTVRVCLSDTVFKTKHDTNGSRKKHLAQSMIVFVFAFSFGLLLKFLFSNSKTF